MVQQQPQPQPSRADQLPSQEQWEAWSNQPLTQDFLRWVEKRKQELMVQWSNGQYLGDGHTETIIRNAGAVGECQMASRILNLDYETFVGDMTNE